jgi:hypothetical protein
MSENLASLKALCEAATKGPWNQGSHNWGVWHGTRRIAVIGDCEPRDAAEEAANHRFVCAARTALPELIGEVERARTKLEQVKWLMENSDGVTGLRNDGSVMEWPTVVRMYVPALAAYDAGGEVSDAQ